MKELEFGELPDMKHESFPAFEQGEWPVLDLKAFPKELFDEQSVFEATESIEELMASMAELGMKTRFRRLLAKPLPMRSCTIPASSQSRRIKGANLN
jgi:hypothetical protein